MRIKLEEQIINDKTKLNENFILEINKLVNGGLGYMDAIVHLCEINNLEIENVIPIIKGNLKVVSAIQKEAESLNYLPKMDRLPI